MSERSPRGGGRRPTSDRGGRNHGSSNNGSGGPTQRQLRVGEALRHAIADILFRNEIQDPDLAGVSVTITQVKPSPDMRYCTVYCEPLGGQNAETIVKALNRHKGFLRGEMGHRLTMKFTPELRFVEDASFAEAQKIETILKSADVQRDLHATHDEDQEED
jgi:ribosome-binding factor A